ncbi:putative membrane-anchored protein [Pseudoxanthomonas sp. 3HH-4]|uniref:DUF2167 domain-containing protein n=1 Tax=Pseudoxanthomonas sp. 3HH-4 TaxID=1690214 RepID=UPI001169A98E|nr:DUF2167 domain-containing protein [Pseudoxanthomonas sp. 3HH-4]TQM17065.1 putative membrane-anchored protein [Pseudoxanthomonas sp. 3HH-4]
MRIRYAALLAAVFMLFLFPCAVSAQEDTASNPIGDLPWQLGPSVGKIGTRATVDVPEGYAFLDVVGTRRLNQLLENPPDGDDTYTLAPHDLSWIGFFSFREMGYVKDDEKVDADDVLESVRKGTEHGNEERRQRGWETMRILGWSFKPQYDDQLKALEWAILAETETSKNKIVNYNTRVLGRRGVMEVIVVADPETLQPAIADFKRLMPGYSFAAGEKYSEFRAGDHVAEVGLAALITGGAAVVASKKGWLAAAGAVLVKMWKLLLIGLFGVAAAVRGLFKRKQKDKTVR